MTEQYFSDDHQLIYDLRVEVKRLHAAIGRMYEKNGITADMIAEALNNKEDDNDRAALAVIYNSWTEKSVDASSSTIDTFVLILKTIKSYL